ncbi:MAG TPA: hypothetical protein DDY91_05025 [Planctomycetaceae bacterium]|nr:hypothetical protein [Planctomycetaceae bacterium]
MKIPGNWGIVEPARFDPFPDWDDSGDFDRTVVNRQAISAVFQNRSAFKSVAEGCNPLPTVYNQVPF